MSFLALVLTALLTIQSGADAHDEEDQEEVPQWLRLGDDSMPEYSQRCTDDSSHQEGDQWGSGSNFFAFGAGRILGYKHNVHTLEEVSTAGFDVVDAEGVLSGKSSLPKTGRVVVSVDGAELGRGDGGCRCMTMPPDCAAV